MTTARERLEAYMVHESDEDAAEYAARLDAYRAEVIAEVVAPKRPSDDHAAVYLDDCDELWAEYPTSPPSDAIVPLAWASEECRSKQEMEDRGVTFRVIGWSK
jgi:hypothetical protein